MNILEVVLGGYLFIIRLYIYITAIWLTPGGSSTVHIYTQTVHIIQRTGRIKLSKNETYTAIKFKLNWEVRGAPRLCELHPGISLTNEEKARKNLS
jgi:hypothetical protein